VVRDLKGALVPVPDFDLLMVLLGEKMGIRLLDEEIEVRAHARTKRYRDRIARLDTVKHPNVAEALKATECSTARIEQGCIAPTRIS
jgi:hypothetical protein